MHHLDRLHVSSSFLQSVHALLAFTDHLEDPSGIVIVSQGGMSQIGIEFAIGSIATAFQIWF